MAKSHQLTIAGHPNIYEYHDRELQLHFCEPESGVNADTGILLLIAGFGESASDSYYEHARSYFADTYNLVTVQAEYFGSAFMGSTVSPKFLFKTDALKQVFKEEEWDQIFDGTSFNMDRLIELGSQYQLHLEGHVPLEESMEHFNDMGIMQAIDNISAVLAVSAILKDNGLNYNAGRIIVYGQGHGAYLGYLCNAFAPKLFSLVLDHSGWLLPPYLKGSRQLTFRRGRLTYSVRFDYLASKIDYDEELLSLRSLYRRLFNNANVLCFQEIESEGKGDSAKKSFFESLKYGMYNEFLALNEGVDATSGNMLSISSDYMKLFDYVMNNVSLNFERNSVFQLPSIVHETKKHLYAINYETGMPILDRVIKNKR